MTYLEKNSAHSSVKKAAYRQGVRGDWKWQWRNARTADEMMVFIVDNNGNEYEIESWELDWMQDLSWSDVQSL
jgi:hypothetical protein